MAVSFELFSQVNVWSCKVWPTQVDTTFWYTWAAQTWTVPTTGQYCIEVRWAQWGDSACATGDYSSWARWAYAAWKICLTQGCTLNIYVGWAGCPSNCLWCHTVCWWYNWWWSWWWVCYSSWWSSTWWWGWWTDVRYNWTTLYNRFIVAWGWAGWATGACGSWCACSLVFCCWWWWGACWCWAWWWTQTSAWRCGSFWCWANALAPINYRSTTPWWWGWRYWWWGCCCNDCYVSNTSSAIRCGSWWSSYTYTSATCANHPCTACLWSLPLMTNAVCCGCWSSFPSPTWWTETWHTWNWCVRIRSV